MKHIHQVEFLTEESGLKITVKTLVLRGSLGIASVEHLEITDHEKLIRQIIPNLALAMADTSITTTLHFRKVDMGEGYDEQAVFSHALHAGTGSSEDGSPYDITYVSRGFLDDPTKVLGDLPPLEEME